MKNKGFAPLVILLVLLIAALMGIAYLVGSKGILSNKIPLVSYSSPPPSSTSDPTANWKTYTNTTFGFQLKYPDNWFSENCGPGEALLLRPKVKPVCEGEPYEPIQFFSSEEIKSEDEFIKSWLPQFKSTPQQATVTTVKYTKYLVEKVEPAPGPEKLILIRVPLTKGTFKIYVNDLQYETVADQIISTFKFTK